MIVWLLALALAQDAAPEDASPTEAAEPVAAPAEPDHPSEAQSSEDNETSEDVPTVDEPQAAAPDEPDEPVAEITVWGDLAVQRARADVVRDMEALGFKKRNEQDGEVVFKPPRAWMGKAYLDYDGYLSFGRPVVGLKSVDAHQTQVPAEGAETNPNLSRSPAGQANPDGDGYVVPHLDGSFWLLPNRRLLETHHQRIVELMTPALERYREVVIETRKHQ